MWQTTLLYDLDKLKPSVVYTNMRDKKVINAYT